MNDRVPAEVFSPGDYIKEELEERGWTQNDLADVLGRPLQLVNEIILGKRGVTLETAKGLAAAFETSAQLWLNLDAAWQVYKNRNQSPDPAIAVRARLYSKAPIKEMVKRGWIEYSSNPDVLEQRILDFLSVKSLDESPPLLLAAARMGTPYEAFNPSQWAWLCQAKRLAPGLPVFGKFDPSSGPQLLGELQALLLHPEEIRRVPQVLAEHGIRFLVLEHLTKTRIDGACLWLDAESPLIAMSLRYDRIDNFWFTLMHEVKHVLNGDGKSDVLAVDIDLLGEGSVKREMKPDFEQEADAFAEEALIRQTDLKDFIYRKAPMISETDIRGFAYLHKIHPGLVVGQLNHAGMSYSKFRHLLVKIRDTLTSTAMTDGWGHRVPTY